MRGRFKSSQAHHHGPDQRNRWSVSFLEASRHSTCETGLTGIRQAESYLQSQGKELVIADRADLEAFIGDLLSRRAASTAWTDHKSLRVLYAWLVEEQEINANPMRMKPPIVPEQPATAHQECLVRAMVPQCP